MDTKGLYPLSREEQENRIVWASVRAVLEAFRYKHKRSGKKSRSNWTFFERLLQIFSFFLKMAGIHEKGLKNAKNILVKNITVSIDNLPGAFEGLKILHLSDLHIDAVKGLEDIVSGKIKPLEYDLCVMTGDYRKDTGGGFRQIMEPMKKIVQTVDAPLGIFAVLGNHDTWRMVRTMEEELGIRMLVNEHVRITKNNTTLTVSGTDDTFYYYTDDALNTFENSGDGFKIALSHTSELHDIAAKNGYGLYLCGHTHGGQICLPGGIPVIAHQKEGKKFTKGFWKSNGMTGYTSPGVGVSGIPIRYNCPGEIVLITLQKSNR